MTWACSICTGKNLDGLHQCIFCHAFKPALRPPAPAVKPPLAASAPRAICSHCRAAYVTLFCEQCRTATCAACDAARHLARGGDRRPAPSARRASASARARAARECRQCEVVVRCVHLCQPICGCCLRHVWHARAAGAAGGAGTSRARPFQVFCFHILIPTSEQCTPNNPPRLLFV